MRALAVALQLDDLFVIPYSLRRGGATQLFRDTSSMDAVKDCGRWQPAKPAKIYVDLALRDLSDLQLKAACKKLLAKAKEHLLRAL